MRITPGLWVAFLLSILGTASVSAALAYEWGKQSVPPAIKASEFIKASKDQVDSVCYVWWFKTPPKEKVRK